MDSKILNFIVGIVVGICITTAGFLIYMKVGYNNFPKEIPNMQMREFNKNGGDFNKEEIENLKNENRKNRNEGDINSNVGESKGVPQILDSTKNT